MYLFERLIGVSIYFLITLIITILISKSRKSNLGRILFLLTMLLSIMAYFYVPAESADLYRLLEIKNYYATLSFDDIRQIMQNSSTPVADFYLYIIGKLGNDGLLAMITCFIFYTNVFGILKRAAKKYTISSNNIALTLLFFMSSGIFIEVISGIRTMLSFSIIASCIYKEIIEKKSIFRNMVWYLIASLMHPAALILTIIRLAFMFIQDGTGIIRKLLNLFIIIITILFSFIYGGKYIESTYDKVLYYMSGQIYSYIWEYIIGGCQLLIMILIIKYYSRYCKQKMTGDLLNNLYKFCYLILIMLIMISFEYNTFHRFVLLCSILILPVLLNTLEHSSSINSKYSRYKINNLIYWFSLLILVLSCIRGNISALKFFIW